MSVQILVGDVRARLAELPDESVQCCVTSPPYWGLRSYLPADDPDKAHEIGSEATVDEWVDVMVGVLRDVRRVLCADGTLFLNLGDSYANNGKSGGNTGGKQSYLPEDVRKRVGREKRTTGLKPKDLIGQPWMLAFALRADGWWLRQEIIWSKPNPMPESTRDRCTKAHEHVFLLTKSERYFWNFDAVQEPVNGGPHARKSSTGVGFGHGYDDAPKPRVKAPDGWDTGPGAHGTIHRAGREKGKYFDGASERMGRGPGWRDTSAPDSGDVGRRYHRIDPSPATPKAVAGAEHGHQEGKAARMAEVGVGNLVDTRNPRSVWTFPSEPFKGAHYATFPTELPRRCIEAGTREGDTVLDPFLGSGTTAVVADRMGRHCIGIDLDVRNEPMARQRIDSDAGHVSRTRSLFVEGAA